MHSFFSFLSRIVLPLDVDEFKPGQRWSFSEACKYETGGGEGIEVINNESVKGNSQLEISEYMPMDIETLTGQYTHKVFHLKSKLPRVIGVLTPRGSVEVHEKAYNFYPYTQSIFSHPDQLRENFYLKIMTIYVPNDRGEQENIFKLNQGDLSKRVLFPIDIANDPIADKDYIAEWDPTKVGSVKANRAPIKADGNGTWKQEATPVMCCYKLVKVMFRWWGLQERVEKLLLKAERRCFLQLYRQSVCWQDRYHGMSMKEVEDFEEKTKEELNVLRNTGEVRGMVEP